VVGITKRGYRSEDVIPDGEMKPFHTNLATGYVSTRSILLLDPIGSARRYRDDREVY